VSSRLQVGGVIRKVWRIYVDEAPVLMPAAAVVFALTGILGGVLAAVSSGLAFVSVLLSLLATTLFTGMIVELVADIQQHGGRDAKPVQLLRAVRPVLGKLILVAFAPALVILLAVGVVGLLGLIFPGLLVITIWSVAAPVVVLERPPGLRALRRSRELVRGNGWQTFGVILVLVVGVGAIASAASLAGESGGTGAEIVVRVVVGVLTTPLSALAQAVLYFELLAAHGERPPRPGGPVRPTPDPFGSG
jgi:hypothetical protein